MTPYEVYQKAFLHLKPRADVLGYCLIQHGSMLSRFNEPSDLDLLATPWKKKCVTPKELAYCIQATLHQIFGRADYHPQEDIEFFWNGCPGLKPHGRLVWSFYVSDDVYVDLSVFPPTEG